MQDKFQEIEQPVPPVFTDNVDADRFARLRVCARCYSDLVTRPVNEPCRGWAVVCVICGASWQFTTVSRKYAESLGQQALTDFRVAQTEHEDLFPKPPRRSEAQILKELGF
jgi:hypothetical protein